MLFYCSGGDNAFSPTAGEKRLESLVDSPYGGRGTWEKGGAVLIKRNMISCCHLSQELWSKEKCLVGVGKNRMTIFRRGRTL